MSNSNVTAPMQFLQTSKEKYANRRFGKKSKYPFALSAALHGYARQPGSSCDTDPLAADHDVIIFEYAGVGCSTGKVPPTVGGITAHVLELLDVLSLETVDVLGFSLGGTTNGIGAALDRPKDDSRRHSTARW